MTQHIKDGGPAFPMARVTVLAEDGTPNEAASITHDGMTLRDYFAAKAMQGYVTSTMSSLETIRLTDLLRQERGLTSEQFYARYSYSLADAMLAEREKGSAK